MRAFILATTASLLWATSSLAQSDAISSNIIDTSTIDMVREWVQKPVVLLSIDAQNTRHKGLNEQRVLELDKQWRAEREAVDQPLIAATLSNPLSSYLTQIQAYSSGLYTEMFVMDNHGLNVGQSSITSDYWQGDEGKFQKTFPQGPGAVFIDEAEFHEGTKTWRAQVNLTVSDPQKNAIGAITVELNLTELARRKGI